MIAILQVKIYNNKKILQIAAVPLLAASPFTIFFRKVRCFCIKMVWILRASIDVSSSSHVHPTCTFCSLTSDSVLQLPSAPLDISHQKKKKMSFKLICFSIHESWLYMQERPAGCCFHLDVGLRDSWGCLATCLNNMINYTDHLSS
jgi:hypothetical protein